MAAEKETDQLLIDVLDQLRAMEMRIDQVLTPDGHSCRACGDAQRAKRSPPNDVA